MYFKRISDLHPLDAKTLKNLGGKDVSKYYALDSLWIEASQSFKVAGDTWTPISSAPTYTDGFVDGDGNKKAASTHETLAATDAFLSRKVSLAELFRNVQDFAAVNITAVNLTANVINTTNLTSTNATITNLTSTSATITNLTSTNATITNLTATNASITDFLTATGASINDLKAPIALIHNLTTTSATITDLTSTTISADNITVSGTATLTAAAAYWADLAELYKADARYDAGTLVKFGGTEEITLADTVANAVVTEKPAYLMNTAIRYTVDHPVGLVLTGRSRVRLIGPINKFDHIGLSQTPGVACKTTSVNNTIGIALETNLNLDEKLVLATLKLTF